MGVPEGCQEETWWKGKEDLKEDRRSGETGIWRQNVDKKRARETERSLWDLAVV